MRLKKRSIAPDFWSDGALGRLTDSHRLLFALLFCAADREHLLADNPREICNVFSPQGQHTPQGINMLLEDLAELPVIIRSVQQGRRVISIPRLDRHQRLYEKESIYHLPQPAARDVARYEALKEGVMPKEKGADSPVESLPKRVNDTEEWKLCLAAVSEVVGEDAMGAWVNGLEYAGLHGTVLRLIAPDEYSRGWVRRFYEEMILENYQGAKTLDLTAKEPDPDEDEEEQEA